MRTRKILLTMLTTLAAVVLAAAPAAADPAGAGLEFARQASANGLDDTQARSLQSQVDTYLAELGGTQTAINKIQLPHGGFALLALPGETYARDLTAPAGVDAVACPFRYLCAYRAPNYTGNIIAMTDCAITTSIPWVTTGSYRNNQTAGTIGHFILTSGRVSNTSPAFSQVASWNWTNTAAIDPC